VSAAYDQTVATDAVTSASLLARAEAERAAGHGAEASVLYRQAADLAPRNGDLDTQAEAVLGLARCQEYKLTPGSLPVQLHATYSRSTDPVFRARLAAALARCWSYAGEPHRAHPFADEALAMAESQDDMVVLADTLDASLTAYWGPDDLDRRRVWALRLGDAAAHLPDPDAPLQAHLWALTLAWETLDLTRMRREMRALEQLAEESPRARFFAASRRLALDLFRNRTDTLPVLYAVAEAASRETLIPDSFGVLHCMTGYAALIAGDARTCAAEAEVFGAYATEQGVTTVRAESVMMWLGAGRLDRVRETIGIFTAEVLAELPRDSDWLLIRQCLLEGALAIKDAEIVSDVLTLLEPYAGRAVINAGAVMFHGVTDDTLGRAAALLGSRSDAEQLCATALATYERIGAVWWRDRLQQATQQPMKVPGQSITTVHMHEQSGGLWLIGRVGHQMTLPNLRGLHHLQALVARPNTAIDVLHLVKADGGMALDEPGVDLIDDQARRAYRARLIEVDHDIDEASTESDLGRLERLTDEREALLEQLRAATGIGGRSRTTGSSRERARIAVRKSIMAAVARVAESDPWLGRHLRNHVRTGSECRYESDPDHPVRWVVGDRR
jgi:tetratricopeptide (TPR) repeat protein